MTDSIQVLKIKAEGKHGVTDLEREKPQILEIDIELDLDLEPSCKSDLLADTVDYSALHNKVVLAVESTSFKLLEALAQSILASVFEDKRILAATIKIAKPEKLGGATPSITLKRTNK